MSGFHKTMAKALPKESPKFRAAKKVNEVMADTLSDLTPKMPAGNDQAIPMPDEEEIKRSKRRSNAARGGSRAATMLSGGDVDTLGG